MTDITPPIPAPAEPSKGKGLFARIVGVFVSPRATFAGYIAAAGYVIVIPIFLAILSGILLGVFNALLGGDASFKQVFAIVSHAGLITVLQTVFVMPLDYIRETLSSPTTLGVFVPFLDEKSFLSHLLGTIDLFQIWWLVVLAIGLGVLYKRRTGPIATS